MNRKQRRSAKHKTTVKYKDSPYLDAVNAAAAKAKPGTVQHLEVQHDDWCDLLNGRSYCNCNPVVGAPKEAKV